MNGLHYSMEYSSIKTVSSHEADTYPMVADPMCKHLSMSTVCGTEGAVNMSGNIVDSKCNTHSMSACSGTEYVGMAAGNIIGSKSVIDSCGGGLTRQKTNAASSNMSPMCKTHSIGTARETECGRAITENIVGPCSWVLLGSGIDYFL